MKDCFYRARSAIGGAFVAVVIVISGCGGTPEQSARVYKCVERRVDWHPLEK